MTEEARPTAPKAGPAAVLSAIRTLEAERDAALDRLAESVPYARFLGVSLERMGDELTTKLPFEPKLVGNPVIPAIHGGVTGSLLEITAIFQMQWNAIWERIEAGGDARRAIAEGRFPPLPRPVDITVDYLRSGRPRAAFARAVVAKKGRRVANVRIEAWQDERDRPFAAAHGHFLLPEPE